jgi:hypothetical protein
MKLYGETRFFRIRQIAADVGVVLWTILWIRIGLFMKQLFDQLAGPGETIEGAGTSFSSTMHDVGESMSDLPGIGDAIQGAFDSASDVGLRLQDAGQGQQDLVHRIAWWLGFLLAAIPIVLLLMRYIPGRLSWIREASAAHRLRIDAADLQLFALRAVTNRPLHELRRACSDPAAALAQGDYAPLARFELASLGLSLEDSSRGRGDRPAP